MKLIRVFTICSIVLILCSGCSNISKSTQDKSVNNSNSGSTKVSETQNNKVLTSDEALNVAKKAFEDESIFGKDKWYKYLGKVKINGVEYHQFSWGSDVGEADSRVCIDETTGKVYVQYVDGKFLDKETLIKNNKK